ncbi:MAG: hypothetical protein V4692_14475, partial [Bdellovibrionota bacterium]
LLGQMDVAADDDMNLDSLPVESPEDQQAKLAIEAIRGLDISKLTPLEALNQIAKWQQSLF